ncbi:hypothetical protein [Candidatus Poriferisocius sp.]|uniref:hypothetical protein n=1 Tax=Candidatus Poriferisocius sp. TaxID=3101276 RepID=UPI003B024DAF
MPTDLDDLAGIVATAKRATEELSDADLRRVAFERVLDHLLKNGESSPAGESAKTVAVQAATPVNAATPSADGVFAKEQQRVDAIARYFKIEPEEVRHIFETSGEEPVLQVHSGGLADSRAEAAREIALLVGGARTALGQETSTSDIRSAADGYGKLDTGNFMKTLGAMSEISVLGRHGSPNRVVRMKVHGAEKARTLAQRLIGG